jgi:3-hydroxyisobutyrate dehydrogenase
MKSIGLIGIGQMGMPMGMNLLTAGYALNIFARNKNAAGTLLEKGARFCENPRQVADESETVLLCLPTPKDVTEVIFGNEGIALGDHTKIRIIIDSSTIDPKSTRNIYSKLETIGIEYLDAPISGGPEGATNATLTFMVGGNRDAFEKGNDVFRALGKNIFYMGSSGSGTGAKLVNQLLVSSNTLASAEAMQLAAALGVDSTQIIDVIKTSAGDSFAFRRVAPKIASQNFGSGWQTWLLEKDLRILLQTEKELGLPSVSVKASSEVFSEAVKSGLGNVDSSSVIKVLEKMKPQSN